MKIDWKRKLTSRKWWAAIISLVISIAVIFNVDNASTERITALITAASTVIAYTLSEGFVDAKTAEKSDNGDENN